MKKKKKAVKRPTDEEILDAVKAWGSSAPTYVIRNRLSMGGFKNIETPWVLRQMKRLERGGVVKRVPSSYAVMLSWAAAAASPSKSVS